LVGLLRPRPALALPPPPPGAEALFDAVRWLSAEQTPWGCPVLDVGPVTGGVEPRLRPEVQAVADGWTGEDGAGLGPLRPPEGPALPGALRLPLSSADPAMTPDGALFRPQHPSERHALYLRDGWIWALDAHTRAVRAAAPAAREGAVLVIGPLHAGLLGPAPGGGPPAGLDYAQSGDPAMVWATFTWLLRSHALGELLPAPLPPALAGEPRAAALWASGWLGRRCLGLAAAPALPAPTRPLRVDGALLLAAQRGDLAGLQRALAAGAAPAAPGSFFGYTALHAAAAMGEAGCVAALLAAGAPVNAEAEDGATPLLAAAAQHGPDTAAAVGLLIAAGARLDARLAARGEAAVHLAAQAGRGPVLARLIGAGADVHAATDGGFTALHMAAELGRADLVTLLRAAGADPRAAAGGLRPADLAAAKGHATLAAALRSAGG
jgi:ankyrin repeat protein